MTIANWNIEAMTGYEPKTTFYTDFSIADMFGEDGVRDTYRRSFKNWHNNTEYITELAMVMSWKSFEHEHDPLCKVYCELYHEVDNWCCENLKGDDLSYYFNTTD